MRKLSPTQKCCTKGRRRRKWVLNDPCAFDNTGAVPTHLESAEWVRPGRVLITRHKANVLPCHLYYFMAQNGGPENTRGFFFFTRCEIWMSGSLNVSFCFFERTINQGMSPCIFIQPANWPMLNVFTLNDNGNLYQNTVQFQTFQRTKPKLNLNLN